MPYGLANIWRMRDVRKIQMVMNIRSGGSKDSIIVFIINLMSTALSMIGYVGLHANISCNETTK